MRTITNDEVLFTCTFKSDSKVKLSLWKQSYSDGTCFYTLQDVYKHWKVDHGSHDVADLIQQMQHELNIHNEYCNAGYVSNNEKVQEVYENYKVFLEEILSNLDKVLQIAITA